MKFYMVVVATLLGLTAAAPAEAEKVDKRVVRAHSSYEIKVTD
jgi:hypothetical protein